MHAIPCVLCHHRVLVSLQGDLLNEVGNGVGQWANELSKAAAGAAEVLGGVVQKAGENIKDGKLVSTAGSHCNRSPAAGAPAVAACGFLCQQCCITSQSLQPTHFQRSHFHPCSSHSWLTDHVMLADPAGRLFQ